MNNLISSLPITKFIVIGSFPLGIRYSKDIDVICFEKDVKFEFSKNDNYSGSFEWQGRRIELLFADEQESFIKILETCSFSRYATVSELYAIKRGHIHVPNRQWDKHIHDLHILKSLTNIYRKDIIDLVKLHKKSTDERVGKIARTPKLVGVKKEKFFDDYVKKIYVHDQIHEVMAHKEKPMYTYMQKNPEIVECSKDLWNNFSFEEKVWTVLEESYVIALERHLIPTMEKINTGVPLSPFQAFRWALMRVCTNLCSGWFRDFAIDNYFDILNSYDTLYFEKFKKAVEDGRITKNISTEESRIMG